MSLSYRDYAAFLAGHFPGRKMQKLAVNIGSSCPNRDGTKGRGGCSYCDNRSFNPSYCSPAESVSRQLERGKEFFVRKYPEMRYLAYFQAYTNTHGSSAGHLRSIFEEALAVDGVDGLVIGTRPDCLPPDILAMIAALPGWKMLELGAESAHDATLERVNRCHTWDDTADAVSRAAALGIPVGLHLIMGLPGEDEAMMLGTIRSVNRLPGVSTVKIHQLQLLRGTRLERDVAAGKCDIIRFTPDSYADLCVKIVATLRPDIAIERFVSQAPPEMLVYPRWGLKNYQFSHLLAQKFEAL